MLLWYSLSAFVAARHLALPWSSQVWELQQQTLRLPIHPLTSHSVSLCWHSNKDWHPCCEESAPWTKRLHTPSQVVSAILRLTTPKKPHLLRTPVYPTKYRISSQERLSLYKGRQQIFPHCTEDAGRKSVSLHEKGCGTSTVPANFLIWITVQWIPIHTPTDSPCFSLGVRLSLISLPRWQDINFT